MFVTPMKCPFGLIIPLCTYKKVAVDSLVILDEKDVALIRSRRQSIEN